MPGGIGVLKFAVDHVRDGLETPMRMIRRTDRLAGSVLHRTEFVDHQKRIDLLHAVHGKRPMDEKAAAFMEILGGEHKRDVARSHTPHNPWTVAVVPA